MVHVAKYAEVNSFVGDHVLGGREQRIRQPV